MSIEAGKNGSCPHCGTANKFETVPVFVPGWGSWKIESMIVDDGKEDDDDDQPRVRLSFARCGNDDCRKVIIFREGKMIVPLSTVRPEPQKEVPESIAEDYKEACLVEPLSQKAAAALARRCLQNLLKDKGINGTGKHDLSDQIDEAMKALPTDLADDVDTIRIVGNYAAHPNKSKSTGEIIEVEPHETEYLLDTLYSLFDHYYVRPAKSAAKRAALQAKLKAAGSGATIKTTSP